MRFGPFPAVLTALLLLAPRLEAAEAFDRSPEALLASAATAKLDAESGAVVLEEEQRITFDAQGRERSRFRRLYYVRNAGAVEDWSTISVSYTPWYQKRPVVRARVITAAGKEHWLDAKTLTDSPAEQYDQDIYSDRRIVSAPLPAVAAGSVVEWEYVVEDTAPFFDAGVVSHWNVGSQAPTGLTEFSIEAPATLPLRVSGKLLPEGALRSEESGGVRRWSLRLETTPKSEAWLPLLPPEIPQARRVIYSTGADWNAVASRYAAIVDRQVAGADLAALGLQLPAGDARPVRARIEDLLLRIHRQVRYVGIELGDGSLIPRKPAEVLANRYGDCKDKAALLVAALRGAGIPASVALLDASTGEDEDPEAPGLGGFNHAIVYVPGPEPLWIDATAENYRLGSLPAGDQGRWALVAAADTRKLVRTGVVESSGNWSVTRREIRIPDPGKARMLETIETAGSLEAELRQIYAGEETKEMREALAGYAKESLLANEAKLLAHPGHLDYAEPFRLRWETPATGRALADRAEGIVAILTGSLFADLPYWFKRNPADEEQEPTNEAGREYRLRQQKRTEDFFLPEPYRAELVYHIIPPANFKLKQMPESRVEEMGPGRYEAKFASEADGSVTARLSFEIKARRVPVAEARALREKVYAQLSNQVVSVPFLHEAEEKLALGQVTEALRILRKTAAAEPKAAVHQSRLARAYLQAGLGDLARKAAARAVELEPQSADALRDQAFVLQHDLLGRHFEAGWDQAGTIAALEKVTAMDKDDVRARVNLAITYEHDPDGLRYSSRSRLPEAIAVYAKLGDKLAQSGVSQNYPLALLMAGRFDEMTAQLPKLGNPQLAGLLRYTAQAVRQGPAAAILAVQQELGDPGSRAQTLLNVGMTLAQMRRYPAAAELFRAAGRINPNPAVSSRADLFAKLRPNEEVAAVKGTPTEPFFSMSRQMFSGQIDVDALRNLFLPVLVNGKELSGLGPADLAKLDDASRQLLSQLKTAGFTRDHLLDFVIGGVTFEQQGSEENGFRLTSVPQPGMPSTTMFVLRDGDVYKLGGGSTDLDDAARVALSLLAANRLAAAQQWMDWVVEVAKQENSGDEIAVPTVTYLWSGVNAEGRSAKVLTVAAHAVIAAKDGKDAEAVKVFETALASAKLAKDRVYLLTVLAQAHKSAGRGPELLATARRLAAAAPKSAVAFNLLIDGLIRTQRIPEARQVAEARLKAQSKAFKSNVEVDDPHAIKALARIAMAEFDWKTASAHYDRLARERNFDEDVKSDAVWLRVRAGNAEDLPFQIAADTETAGAKPSPAALAMAAWHAMRGQVAEARSRLLRGGASGVGRNSPEVTAVLAGIARAAEEPAEAARFEAMIPAKADGEKIAALVAESYRKP